MLDFELLRDKGILIVTPHGPLEKADFERVAKEVDPYLAKDGMLRGVMLYAQAFPGWDSFAALLAHFKFMRYHQRKIERLAVVTDFLEQAFAVDRLHAPYKFNLMHIKFT